MRNEKAGSLKEQTESVSLDLCGLQEQEYVSTLRRRMWNEKAMLRKEIPRTEQASLELCSLQEVIIGALRALPQPTWRYRDPDMTDMSSHVAAPHATKSEQNPVIDGFMDHYRHSRVASGLNKHLHALERDMAAECEQHAMLRVRLIE